MGVFTKLGHIVKVFHGEEIAELVIEDVSLGLTSTMGEPILLLLLEREDIPAASHLLLLIKRHMFFVLSSAIMSFTSSSVYLPGFFLDDLVSFPVLGLVRCFGQSPCPILPTTLPLQVVVDP